MKEWRKSKVYKAIRNSGYTFKQVCSAIQHYNAIEIKHYATQSNMPSHLLNEIERAIKTLNNKQHSMIAHLDLKFRIGQDVYYIDCCKGRIIIRLTKVLGFGIRCPSQDQDILYLCDLFEFANKKTFYDDEIFHSIKDAKQRIKESKTILDVIHGGVVSQPKKGFVNDDENSA